MKIRVLHGTAVGGLLTACFVATSYLGWKLGGLPFLPFDLFDWVARELPGWLVTFAIDSGVALGSVLHVDTIATSAKIVEETLAIAASIGAGVVAGGALFAALAFSDEPALLFGGVLGAALGGVALLIERTLDRITPGALAASLWVVASCLLWGFAFGWAYERLRSTASGPAPAFDNDRRRFLVRLAFAIGTPTLLTGIWGVLIGARRPRTPGARWSDDHELPNTKAAVTPVPGTRAEFTPLEDHYRIDVDTRMPTIEPSKWRLRIAGLVERPRELTLGDLRLEEPLHQFVTLSCISNPIAGDLIGTTRWTGVSLERVIDRAVPEPRGTHVKIISADGFFEVVSLDLIRSDPRVMLTYAWDGVPLAMDHGFPLRIYIPDVYGMKQPKWIVAAEVLDRWEPGYWVTRGWDRDGRMKATSVVDTAKAVLAAPTGEARSLVTVGGIAHAGARQVSRVEARVDEGPWQQAHLRDPLSDTTWVVWRADLPATPGEHGVTVRCYEGDDTPQDGSFHTKRIKI